VTLHETVREAVRISVDGFKQFDLASKMNLWSKIIWFTCRYKLAVEKDRDSIFTTIQWPYGNQALRHRANAIMLSLQETGFNENGNQPKQNGDEFGLALCFSVCLLFVICTSPKKRGIVSIVLNQSRAVEYHARKCEGCEQDIQFLWIYHIKWIAIPVQNKLLQNVRIKSTD
jgi:hypothetical protein